MAQQHRKSTIFADRRLIQATMCLVLLILAPCVGGLTDSVLDIDAKQLAADYESRLKALMEEGVSFGEARRQAADAALKDIELSNLTFKQIAWLLPNSEVCEVTSRVDEVDARLGTFAAQNSVDGAQARVLRLNFIGDKPAEAKPELIKAMLDHPKLDAALQHADLWFSFMNFAWYIRPDDVRGLEDQLIALGEHIPEKAPMLGVLGAIDVFRTVTAADPEGYERREPLRKACVAALRRLATYVDPKHPSLQNWNFSRDIPGHIEGQITLLEGPAVRGTLMKGPAPEIDFIKVIGREKQFKSLSDLRGKIVVMDFWATWCGPCIASFPEMRELVEKYRDQPVEFIGVTAIQGAHYQSGEQVDCKDDPEKEMKLMEGLMKELDMTWPVAFSKQPVYNPTYGIRGIPHVIVLNPEGWIAANDLHPKRDHDQIAQHINALLKEMGVEPPAQQNAAPRR